MPLDLFKGRIPESIPVPAGIGRDLGLEAAGRRPATEENGNGVMLPPAGASRAEALFSAVGIALIVAIVLSALWILIRRR
ncbi:hypothetical protein [Microvirga roseola]|uniref:hypothetical protein n=1 Tax=Microvirga roseola TaxID=2883126 RepID=UPI001E5D1FF5|nr:hypothetical protein [Microvirga roseola]